MIKDCYPLPLIQDSFNQHGGAVLNIGPQKWLLADPNSPTEHPEHCIPMSLRHAISHITIDRVLHGLISKCCFVYIDNIIIYSRNVTEHAYHLILVMDKLREAGLKLKPGKCKFKLTCSETSKPFQKTQRKPREKQSYGTMTPPRSVSEVRSMSMTGYY